MVENLHEHLTGMSLAGGIRNQAMIGLICGLR